MFHPFSNRCQLLSQSLLQRTEVCSLFIHQNISHCSIEFSRSQSHGDLYVTCGWTGANVWHEGESATMLRCALWSIWPTRKESLNWLTQFKDGPKNCCIEREGENILLRSGLFFRKLINKPVKSTTCLDTSVFYGTLKLNQHEFSHHLIWPMFAYLCWQNSVLLVLDISRPCYFPRPLAISGVIQEIL